jgi:hypothetical protein
MQNAGSTELNDWREVDGEWQNRTTMGDSLCESGLLKKSLGA